MQPSIAIQIQQPPLQKLKHINIRTSTIKLFKQNGFKFEYKQFTGKDWLDAVKKNGDGQE